MSFGKCCARRVLCEVHDIARVVQYETIFFLVFKKGGKYLYNNNNNNNNNKSVLIPTHRGADVVGVTIPSC